MSCRSRFLAGLRWGLLLAGVTVAASACSKGDVLTANTHARTDTTLQALAATAWSNAGYSGQTATPIDATNASTVSAPLIGVIGAALQSVQLNHGVSLAMALGVSPQGLAALRNTGVSAPQGAGARPLSTVNATLNDTFACPSGGSIWVTGTLVGTGQSGLATASTGVSFGKTILAVSGCTQAGLTYTGSMLYNAVDRYYVEASGTNRGIFSIHLDEYMDGGLAATDGASYYNPLIRLETMGALTVTVDNTSAVLGLAGNIASTLTLDTITCSTTVTFDGLLQRSTGAWTCK